MNTFWNPKWGGALRIYDSPQQGLDGRDEHIKNHQVAEIEFKPNRLIMFDGRIPHGADAPTPSARYMDRRSLVLRGDEVRLTHTEENYDANDRLSYL
jgi:Rps23 Pro-64 3,4-dihydroxylase Tpa1-like proline 4-hydroxylase